VHRREQRRGAEVVVGGVRREVADPDTRTDQRRLVAHDVGPPQKACPSLRPGVTDVELVHPLGRRADAVRGVQHQIDTHDLVAGFDQLLPDDRADEAGGTGQQDLHPRASRPGTS
jgi:hypothetical protein